MSVTTAAVVVVLFIVVTSANAEIMRSVAFVCHSFCLSVCTGLGYCRTKQPVSLKLDVMIGPTIGRTD